MVPEFQFSGDNSQIFTSATPHAPSSPTETGGFCLPSLVPLNLPTARLLLRTPAEADRAAFLAARAANHAYLQPWEPLRPSESPEDGFTRLLASADSETTQRAFIFAAHTLVGGIALSNISRGPFQNATIGYWLTESAQGHGYMLEALPAILAHGFGPTTAGGLGLHRIECNVMPRNARSIALARRIGFREEGFSPRYLQINGVWEGHLRFAMTAEEFPLTAANADPHLGCPPGAPPERTQAAHSSAHQSASRVP